MATTDMKVLADLRRNVAALMEYETPITRNIQTLREILDSINNQLGLDLDRIQINALAGTLNQFVMENPVLTCEMAGLTVQPKPQPQEETTHD